MNEMSGTTPPMTPAQHDLVRRIILVRAMRKQQDVMMANLEKEYRASRKAISNEIETMMNELRKIAPHMTLPEERDIPLFSEIEQAQRGQPPLAGGDV